MAGVKSHAGEWAVRNQGGPWITCQKAWHHSQGPAGHLGGRLWQGTQSPRNGSSRQGPPEQPRVTPAEQCRAGKQGHLHLPGQLIWTSQCLTHNNKGTPPLVTHTFTLTYCLCFQFSAFCWVTLAARVCQGWVLGVLARQVPTVGKPTGPLTILRNIGLDGCLTAQPADKAFGAKKTLTLFL